MIKKMIAANWKMNLLKSDAKLLANSLIENFGSDYSAVDVVLAPPFTLLDAVGNLIKGSNIKLCAQNMYPEESGAFTGEISPLMLKDLNCTWVIIGHSERRQIIGETDELVSKKVKLALKCDLKIILCVGETLEQREKGVQNQIIENQVEIALKDVNNDMLKNIVIAYEPVWAIGTGKNATPNEIVEVHTMIKELLSMKFRENDDNIRVLYGGSVKPENIDEIISSNNVDGALVGGASLKADSFSKIVKAAGE